MCDKVMMQKILAKQSRHLFTQLSTPDKKDLLADALHQLWMEEMIADEWTYGATYDAANKKHPCLVPWAQLPSSYKENDQTIASFVQLAMNKVGLKMS